MTMTTLRRRRLAAAVTAVAVLCALSACGSQAAVGAPRSTSATPGPGTLDGLCSTVMAIDAAGAQRDGGADPTAEPTGTEAPAPDSVDPDSFVYGSGITGADAIGGDAGADATTTDATGGDTTPASPTDSLTAAPTAAPADAPSAQVVADARAVYTPLIAELERNRQPEVADAVDTMLRLARQALETGTLDLLDSPEFSAADETVHAFLPAACG